METTTRVFRVHRFTPTPALLPIGGERPTLRIKGGNKPSKRLRSISTEYGSTNKSSMPGLKPIRFEKPKKK